MAKRTGVDIFNQLIGKVFANTSFNIYLLNRHVTMHDIAEYEQELGFIQKAVAPMYRKAFAMGSEEFYGVTASRGKRNDFVMIYNDGRELKERDVTEFFIRLSHDDGFTTDRDCLMYEAGNEFYQSMTRYGSIYSLPILERFDSVKAMAAGVSWRFDAIPIIRISPHGTVDIDSFTNSIIITKLNNHGIITIIGSNPEDVYSFVHKANSYTLEATPNSHYVEYDQIKLPRSGWFRSFDDSLRQILFGNIFATINDYAEHTHISTPQYEEKYTVYNASQSPFPELLKMAAAAEGGMSIIIGKPDMLDKDVIVEEASKAWESGNYVSLTDNIQPGISRSGIFVYMSKASASVVAISFSLRLEVK